MMKWEPKRKPPPQVCAQRYCFNWLEKGDEFTPGLHDSFEQALTKVRPVTASCCSLTSTLGVCSRTGNEKNDGDLYEPNEPALAKDRLPWFYFIPSPENLVLESRARYVRESEALWGQAHWLTDTDQTDA